MLTVWKGYVRSLLMVSKLLPAVAQFQCTRKLLYHIRGRGLNRFQQLINWIPSCVNYKMSNCIKGLRPIRYVTPSLLLATSSGTQCEIVLKLYAYHCTHPNQRASVKRLVRSLDAIPHLRTLQIMSAHHAKV